jgi:acetyl esterase/lipase
MTRIPFLTITFLTGSLALAAPTTPSAEQLGAWLKKHPAADSNRDGLLTVEEAKAYRNKAMVPRRPADTREARVPTHPNVKYGPFDKNVLDLWIAPSNRPSPLIIFIHGGGFVGGDKSQIHARAIDTCLAAGAAYASINYRFREAAPLQDILRDAARALQFLRLHAQEYGIDPARIACYGGSAGAGTSLWLATRDDLADPKNADPVLRQSTRICAAACLNGQATYDLTKWDALVGPFRTEWKSDPDEDIKLYHFSSRDDLASETGKKVLEECDMLHWISKDDPPLFLSCTVADVEPTERGQYVHHPRHAKAVKAQCAQAGEPCEIALAPGNGEEAALTFLLKHVTDKNRASAQTETTRARQKVYLLNPSALQREAFVMDASCGDA